LRGDSPPEIHDLRLGDGEMHIRSWHFANLGQSLLSVFGFAPDGRCSIVATNKRIICYSRSNANFHKGESWMEIPMESAGCIISTTAWRISFSRVIISLISIMIGIVLLLNGGITQWKEIGVVLLLFCAPLVYFFLLFLFTKPHFVLRIFSSGAMIAPISVNGSGWTGLSGLIMNLLLGQATSADEFFTSLSATPATKTMLREIGALIQDIKTQGDRGAEKWKQ
jgi:hypothetical protein